MVENATPTDSEEEIEEPVFRKYFVDPSVAEAYGRSLSVLIAGRQCYMCQQGLDEDQIVNSDPQDFVDQIAAHCSQEQDYLLPDTPMKEAIFRVIISRGNDPMDAEQISAVLGEKWAMTPFPRNTSPEVIQRLLDNSGYYCIAALPDPGFEE